MPVYILPAAGPGPISPVGAPFGTPALPIGHWHPFSVTQDGNALRNAISDPSPVTRIVAWSGALDSGIEDAPHRTWGRDGWQRLSDFCSSAIPELHRTGR